MWCSPAQRPTVRKGNAADFLMDRTVQQRYRITLRPAVPTVANIYKLANGMVNQNKLLSHLAAVGTWPGAPDIHGALLPAE
jgi:hypothetical protein